MGILFKIKYMENQTYWETKMEDKIIKTDIEDLQ